jgi:hypothetical protein
MDGRRNSDCRGRLTKNQMTFVPAAFTRGLPRAHRATRAPVGAARHPLWSAKAPLTLVFLEVTGIGVAATSKLSHQARRRPSQARIWARSWASVVAAPAALPSGRRRELRLRLVAFGSMAPFLFFSGVSRDRWPSIAVAGSQRAALEHGERFGNRGFCGLKRGCASSAYSCCCE